MVFGIWSVYCRRWRGIIMEKKPINSARRARFHKHVVLYEHSIGDVNNNNNNSRKIKKRRREIYHSGESSLWTRVCYIVCVSRPASVLPTTYSCGATSCPSKESTPVRIIDVFSFTWLVATHHIVVWLWSSSIITPGAGKLFSTRKNW